jgi:hypothetical protein
MSKFLKWCAGGAALLIVAGIAASPEADTNAAEAGQARQVEYMAEQAGAPKAEAKTKAPAPKAPTMTPGQENALESAESYLDGQAFSKKGLGRQLRFEQFSPADAQWAVNHVKADWMAEAVESATGYLDGQSFSRAGLEHQLRFEGFTPGQAQHGVQVAYR